MYFHLLHHHLQTIHYQMVQVFLLVMQLMVQQLLPEHQYLQVLLQDLDQVFQQHQLIDRLSVLDNVLMGRLGYHSFLRSLLPLPESDRQKALSALERVGLIDKALARVKDHVGVI